MRFQSVYCLAMVSSLLLAVLILIIYNVIIMLRIICTTHIYYLYAARFTTKWYDIKLYRKKQNKSNKAHKNNGNYFEQTFYHQFIRTIISSIFGYVYHLNYLQKSTVLAPVASNSSSSSIFKSFSIYMIIDNRINTITSYMTRP